MASEKRTAFPPVFWVANLIEVLELDSAAPADSLAAAVAAGSGWRIRGGLPWLHENDHA